MALLRGATVLLLCALLWSGATAPAAHGAAATEQQLKAAFLFNFAHFVSWPGQALGSPGAPFVIGVLAGPEIAAQLERAVEGESVEGRAMQVRRFDRADQVGGCQILFIDRGQEAHLERVLARLKDGPVLTVSDVDDAARRGVMIQMARDRSRIRLLINLGAAQAAGLSLSSNLLRPAEIVAGGN